jgi:ferredoxin
VSEPPADTNGGHLLHVKQRLQTSGPVPATGELRPRGAIWLEKRLRVIDGLFNRIYSSQWNPLYKSGTLAVTFLAATLVTGIYLFILYKVADPYGSVERLDATWLGSLMRSIHRYSADLAMVAVAVHVLKMMLAGRTWGPRSLAWITGLLLLGLMLFCGWTGLVMAWDVQGQLVALEGARLLDLLPIFSEPISRSFAQPGAVGRAFFFTNLFLHVALPLGLAGLFWLHSSRVARASFFPPRSINRYALGLVVVVSLLIPVPLPPKADLLAIPVAVPLDLFYAFWLPLARSASAGVHLLAWLLVAAVTFSVPWWWRPRSVTIIPSHVDKDHCAGCRQCYLDCPFEAISMVPRPPAAQMSLMVALVDPSLCVSCGICSGSCAPMGVGPAGRTGRDQIRQVEGFLAQHQPSADQVVLVSCQYGLGAHPSLQAVEGVLAFASGCSGSVHTSVIEYLLRAGAGGVFVLTCPDRDCAYREGPEWVRQRIYEDREAELQPRVDKQRVRVGSFAASEAGAATRAVESFRDELQLLGEIVPEQDPDLNYECEVPDVVN